MIFSVSPNAITVVINTLCSPTTATATPSTSNTSNLIGTAIALPPTTILYPTSRSVVTGLTSKFLIMNTELNIIVSSMNNGIVTTNWCPQISIAAMLPGNPSAPSSPTYLTFWKWSNCPFLTNFGTSCSCNKRSLSTFSVKPLLCPKFLPGNIYIAPTTTPQLPSDF